MPELPEVEVLRRSLAPLICNDTLASLQVLEPRLREPVDSDRLRAQTVGRRICGTRRRAKYLLLDLEDGYTLVFHLGMSGRLTLVPEEIPRVGHEHVSFSLASGRRLRFVDTRRFGLVFSLRSREVESDRHFARLGIEPLSSKFDGEFLRLAASHRRGPIKSFLMNAEVVAGVGNIYACEALYRAGVHPRRSVARISRARWKRLARCVKETLQDAIDQGGTTLNDFADAEGRAGYFKVRLEVYDRAGEACTRCGKRIARIVQGGRGTYYCPGCQR
ncbi:MAG: bifunctional DNA-formamidopyrimidine glycosylase/DNA-(apurinic or apyrimidinic site) lyase [Acidobacteriota bacterium]